MTSFRQGYYTGVIVAVLLTAALSMLAGCASSRHNTTYNTPPPDYQGRQTPHSVP